MPIKLRVVCQFGHREEWSAVGGGLRLGIPIFKGHWAHFEAGLDGLEGVEEHGCEYSVTKRQNVKHKDRCDKFLNLLSKSEIQMHLFTSNALFGHWCILYF